MAERYKKEFKETLKGSDEYDRKDIKSVLKQLGFDVSDEEVKSDVVKVTWKKNVIKPKQAGSNRHADYFRVVKVL